MANPATEPQREQRKPTLLRSVARAIEVLFFVAETDAGRTAKETSLALDIPIGTAYHALNTLAARGMVSKDAGHRYRLGSRVGVLADAFARQLTPAENLLGPLHELAESTDESAHLVGWRHDDVVVLASVEGTQAVRVSGVHTGQAGNAHARASGKALLAWAPSKQREAYLRKHELTALTPHTITDRQALLAELERIRARGYAIEDEEFAEGAACLAAPIIDGGVVIGAYSLSAPAERFRRNKKRLTQAVLAAARSAATQRTELVVDVPLHEIRQEG